MGGIFMLDIILILAVLTIVGLIFTVIFWRTYVIGKSVPASTEQAQWESMCAQVYLGPPFL